MNNIETIKCAVCKHPDRDQIDERLVSGASVREIAAEYDFSHMAVQRHRQNHLPKTLIKAHELQEEDRADKLIQQVNALYDKALSLLEQAERDKKYAPAVAAIREARASLELVGRLCGQVQSGLKVQLNYSPQWINTRTVILSALEEHPAAREQVIKALSDVIEVDFDITESASDNKHSGVNYEE
jgi:hypothetical protein